MKRRYLRIVAGTVALLLIAGLSFVANSFVGNPVSAAIATYRVRQYVQETYPGRDFEVSRATYNMKNSAYSSLVKSQSSYDTRFSVNWRGGGTIWDNYQSQVVEGFNTYVRLGRELDTIVEDIVEREFPYPVTLLIAGFDKPEHTPTSLRLDMSLDVHNPPLPAYLTLWISSDQVTYPLLAERLVEIHDLMQQHNIPFETYSIRLRRPRDADSEDNTEMDDLSVHYIPVELVSQDNLPELLRIHQQQLEMLREERKPR